MASTPVPPRAFMGTNENSINTAIRRMALEQRHMATRNISVEDMRQLFIPAPYRHSLMEAFQVASPKYSDQSIAVPITMVPAYEYPMRQDNRLTATFTWDYDHAPNGFYVPRDCKGFVQDDAPVELLEKWHYVCENLSRISYEFGLVRYVFNTLNTNGFCNTPQQMRYVWPAIRHIADKAKLGDLANSLVEASARAGDRARVPLDIAPFMVPTVNIVNRTLLMDKIDLDERREFKMSVNDPEYIVSGDREISFRGMS